MLGTFRFSLAFMVVANHLLAIPIVGHYAVHGFFILSGYLMTYVMHNTYGYTQSGRVGFLINRFLRLYPLYWVVLAISLMFIAIVGEDFSVRFREFIFIPTDIAGWVQNFFMIYFSDFPASIYPRISPPTWALTVELLFYAIICLGLSYNKTLTIIWLLISLLYIINILSLGYDYRYSHIMAGSLPFALGASIYHFGCLIHRVRGRCYIFGVILLFIVNLCASLYLKWIGDESFWFVLSYYTNYIVCSLLVHALIFLKVAPWYSGLDKFLGDISYPLYLLHWQVGMFTSWIFFEGALPGRSYYGFLNFIVAIMISMLLSYVLVRTVDIFVNDFRDRIRAKVSTTKSVDVAN